ncbi:MAG: major capsid protein [Candidatus Adiutrix sp.]|jgi:hypothetical protein|nr:major capsid protein [Candidatus Adiutrix sp.]
MSQITHPNLFTVAELTTAVNKLPLMPLRLSGLFKQTGVRTTAVALDIQQGRIVLVQNTDRRSNPEHLGGRGSTRSTKMLQAAHLPLADTILPDDIQDVRDFGSAEPMGPETVINDRLQTLKNSVEMTVEHHRLGAVKGVVYDADGSTVLHNLYNIFGVPKKTVDIAFPDNVPIKTNPLLKAILDGKRHAEQKCGGLPITRFEALVGSDFYDALTGHELVREAFELWQANQQNWGDNDYRRRGFTYGGVTWIEASEVVNGRPVVEKSKAHMYPVAPGVFETFYAPANWMETVNTVGLPFYAQMWARDGQRGYELEAQSNPLCVCTFPETLVEFTAK